MLRSFNKIALIFFILKNLSLLSSINGQQLYNYYQIGCTFDVASNLCNWDPLKSQYQSNWQWKSFSTRTVNFTGALAPYNNAGMFIQIFNPTLKESSPATGALQSVLIAPTSSPICFSFYYYIHGVDANKIELYLLPQSSQQLIWSRRYPAGDMWHNYRISIPAQTSSFRVSNFYKEVFWLPGSDSITFGGHSTVYPTPGPTIVHTITSSIN